MKKISILALTLGVFFTSCDFLGFGSTAEQVEVVINDTKFVRKEKIMIVEEEYCQGDYCSDVALSFLEAQGGSLAAAFNQNMQKYIYSLLYNSGWNDSEEVITQVTPEKIEEQMKAFLEVYKSLQGDYPQKEDLSQPHHFEYKDTIVHANQKVISVMSNYYIYSGGAHGYGSIAYANFRPDGTPISNKELIVNEKEFGRVVEKYFRLSKGFPADMPLSETGFFEDGFVLPSTIGFEKDSLVVYYASYEIAPYAYGDTRFYIPISEVKDYITL